jgi:hypothetical protein
MNKPKGYDEAQAYGDYTPLELGGHICKIMSVEEMKSRTGKDMLKISLDIAEGPQKDFYAQQYRNSTFEDKRWGCIVYQLVYDNDGNTNKGLKTFLTSVEESNAGYKVAWGESFCKSLKGKLIGGVFGREQYENRNGELKWSTKCVQFRSVETIKKGVNVPEDKYLKDHESSGHQSAPTNNGDFAEITGESDLPF